MGAKEKQGIRDCFLNASEYNQLEFIIEQKIRQMINTSALVRIDSCDSKGHEGPAGYVSGTPMISQTDSDGNALPMASIPKMPHFRVQGGIAALIVDPVPGDLAVASFCKADSSTVTVGEKKPQRPGSFRSFDQADGMIVATVSNKTPEVWIEIRQDKTIIIHAPEGVKIETDKVCEIHAEQEILLDTPLVRVTGNLVADGTRSGGHGLFEFQGGIRSTEDQIAGGISEMHHTHRGDSGGTTSEPL